MFNVIAFLVIPVILLEALEINRVFKKYPIDGRIIGGHDADIKDYPYMAILDQYDDDDCGAVLIAEKWALTAAQCVYGGDPEYYGIRVNTSFINGEDYIQVANIIVHPNFSVQTKESDIALLELSDPVICTNCKAIPLGTTAPPAGANATILGFGFAGGDIVYTEVLQVAHVPVVDHDICTRNYAFIQKNVTENMLCAGYIKTGSVDSCYGDAGGPLVIDGILFGIYSSGHCAESFFPGIYTMVPNFLDWIRKNTGITV